ncbi:hypothetical protein [Roseovarius autotrophicus]|uniref:hypothetical protein n=1 Tax=Roseovarius autotrophicus TaxID=2824121 RepID=UPI00300D81E3
MSNLDDLTELIDATHPGSAAKKKTRTVLNRLWLEPRPDLADFAERGVEIYRGAPDTPVSALTWGMALATYPFFGKVAEIVGRLTSLQGDCTSAEVHRRMAEIFGEREGTRRMTNMVLQSQASWGAIERVDKGKRIVRSPLIELDASAAAAWLAEACVRYAGRPLSVAGIGSNPIVYPFSLKGSSAYLFSQSPYLEMRADSAGNQMIDLATCQRGSNGWNDDSK